MPAKNPPTGTAADLNLATMAGMFASEEQARTFLERRRWPNGPACPRCKSTSVYTLTAKPGSAHPVPPGVYKCGGCRKKFTVRIGTIMEESKIPICKWLMAIHLMTSSKKGISSHQISRECGITQKSAWFMNHRIRKAMELPEGEPPLKGTVEADEVYIGGKPRHGTGNHKRGRGTSKAPVAVLVERDGNCRIKPIENVTSDTLVENICINVDSSAKIVTDEFSSYAGIGEAFDGGHSVVKHAEKIYVNLEGEHVNTAESFNALIKRGHYGIFHKLSKFHLHRYCSEFEFRWNRRKISDGERMMEAIKGIEGKRLMYQQSKEVA